MIVQEYYSTRSDGTILIRSYSDRGVYIKNPEGQLYTEAIDPKQFNRTYEETSQIVPIVINNMEQGFSDKDALDIILGRDSYD
jgi:hypothetical protein